MGQPIIEQGPWRFYTDATSDGSMVALADEDTAPTLTQAQMENGIIRLRVQICETGGSKGDDQGVELQWSPDGTNYRDVGGPSTPSGQEWVFWADGAATGGSTIGSQLLTGTTTSGAYHEQADQSEAVGINDEVEIDCALRIQWPPPSSTLHLRIAFGGSAINVKSGSVAITFTTPTVANRSHTIARSVATTDDSPWALWGSSTPRVFWDGTYWWLFLMDNDNSADTTLYYYYWSGSGAWSSAGSTTFTNTMYPGRDAVWLEVLGGTPVVLVFWNDSTGNAMYRRGTISGTTITWGSETSTGAAGTNHDAAVGLDDGGYWWLAWVNSGVGVGARRSTNADNGSWTPGWNSAHTAADTGVTVDGTIACVGLASDKALLVWYSGTALKWALVDDTGGIGTVNTLASTANQFDWGLARAGGYVYLVHTDSTVANGNWVLQVFNESSETWSTGTSPSVNNQGAGGDGLVVTAWGTDDIFCHGTFSYDAYGNRCVKGKKYNGPGTSGTWDSLVEITPDEARGNGDNLAGPPAVANEQLPIVFTFCDADLGDYYSVWEYHVLSVPDEEPPTASPIMTPFRGVWYPIGS